MAPSAQGTAATMDRRELYKVATNKLVQWLAETASNYCDVRELLRSSSAQTLRNRKHKGKGRNHASGPVKIEAHHMVMLARAITSAEGPVAIPADILHLAKDTICGRQCCADWYAAQSIKSGTRVTEQLDAHTGFTTILQTVHDVLAGVQLPHRSTESSQLVIISIPDAQSHHLHDLLAKLDLETKPVDSHDTASGSDSKSVDFHFVGDDDENVAFVLWCALQDLHDMRTFVRDTWLQYGKGELSLLVAGVITDAAFGLMRHATERLAAIQSGSRQYRDVLDFLDLVSISNKELAMVFPAAPGTWPKTARSDVNPATLLSPSAHILLEQFGDVAIGFIKGDNSQDFEDSKVAARLFPTQPFGATLLTYLPRILRHAQRTKKERKRGEYCDALADEFLGGLCAFCAHPRKEWPIWMVMSCRTYMDIYDIVGNELAAAADALLDCYTNTTQAVPSQDPEGSSANASALLPSTKHFNVVAQEGVRFTEWLSDLKIASPAASTHLREKRPSGLVPVEIILDLPVMACKMLYGLKAHNSINGALMADYGSNVLALAFLYAAGRRYGLVTMPWLDMDFVIAHNLSAFDDTPKVDNSADAFAIFNFYQAALGMPAAGIAQLDSKSLPTSSIVAKKAKKVSIQSNLIQSVVQHAHKKAALGISFAPTIDVALDALAGNDELSHKATIQKLSSKFASGSETRNSPAQLLDSFRESFAAEEPQLNFDYISFSRICATATTSITKALSDQMEHRSTADPPGYEVVYLLLRDAAQTQADGRPMASTAVSQASKILQSCIAKEERSTVRERKSSQAATFRRMPARMLLH